MPRENHENNENHKIPCDNITKIIKINEFEVRINKTMKILKFNARITKIKKSLEFQKENNENK